LQLFKLGLCEKVPHSKFMSKGGITFQGGFYLEIDYTFANEFCEGSLTHLGQATIQPICDNINHNPYAFTTYTSHFPVTFNPPKSPSRPLLKYTIFSDHDCRTFVGAIYFSAGQECIPNGTCWIMPFKYLCIIKYSFPNCFCY